MKGFKNFVVNLLVSAIFGGFVGGFIGLLLYFFSSECSCYYFCNPHRAPFSGMEVAIVYFIITGRPVIKHKNKDAKKGMKKN
ncbi:MAG: hypothetical protein U9O97_02720 [Elusimicrobiota bacterium]|nr:hypothetical protein [Elusimicrobiota bacterium]